MTYRPQSELADPVLEIWLDEGSNPAALRCAGRLDRRTRPGLLQSVAELLEGSPSQLVVDVTAVKVADAGGAAALVGVQRMARSAGATLVWRGVQPKQLGGFVQAVVSRRQAPGVVRSSSGESW